MNVGDKVVALRDIPVIDVNTFLPVPAVQKDATGTIIKDARKEMRDGTELRAICVEFPGVGFPVVVMWKDVEETIRLA